jgi:hypothetical protein
MLALPQILLNRLSIVIPDKRRMRILRQGIFVLGMLEVLVAGVIWIPARLGSSKTSTDLLLHFYHGPVSVTSLASPSPIPPIPPSSVGRIRAEW